MIIFRVSIILHLGMKMADHCIPYVFFYEKPIHERMIFLFVKLQRPIVVLNCWYVLWLVLFHPSLGKNMCWRLCLVLDSLVCITLTLFVDHIFVLIIAIGTIGGVMCSTLLSILVWYIVFVTKACSSRSSICKTVSTHYGNTYSTSSLSKSSSHSSWI